MTGAQNRTLPTADEATTTQLLELTERYCVIAQTLAHPLRSRWVCGRSETLQG